MTRKEVVREGRVLDEDRAAVLKMFGLIKETVDSLEGNFQVLITEHADLSVDWFQSAIVEKWLDDKALIRREWLNAVEGEPAMVRVPESDGALNE